jgi:hypothetical protein
MDDLALTYQAVLHIPDEAAIDCTHLAVCVLHRVDYLLSWNFAHLGDVAQKMARIYNEKNGLWTPRLVSPENINKRTREEVV